MKALSIRQPLPFMPCKGRLGFCDMDYQEDCR